MNQQKKQAPVELKVGQTFPLTIKRLGINGEGVGYFKKKSSSYPARFLAKKLLCRPQRSSRSFRRAALRKSARRLSTGWHRLALFMNNAADVSFSTLHTASSFGKNAISSFSLLNAIRSLKLKTWKSKKRLAWTTRGITAIKANSRSGARKAAASSPAYTALILMTSFRLKTVSFSIRQRTKQQASSAAF